jgi:hypothetical protein
MVRMIGGTPPGAPREALNASRRDIVEGEIRAERFDLTLMSSEF